MNFEDLKNPELQEKLKACQTPEELAALVKEQGLELSDEQLEAFAGGEWYEPCMEHVKPTCWTDYHPAV